MKCTLPSPFAEGKYLVKVKGTDIDKPTGNTFTAYDDSGAINDGVYIIKFLKNISGPRIRPHRIDGYHNASFEVKADITGLDGTSVVYYNIDVDVDAVPDPAKKLLPDSGNPQLYKATVPVGTLPDGDHEIHFLARNSSGGQDKVSTTFKVDRTAPEVKLNYPDINDPQVGEEIEIGGTITDFYAGVDPDKTKWMIVPNTSTPPTVTTTSGWKDMTQSTTGSWKFTADLNTIVGSVPQNYGTLETSGYYKIPVYILAQDKKGNKAVHTLHILFDKDGKKPVVKILSPKDNITTGGTIQLFGTAKAPKGGPSAVGGVYIQFSKNGNFTGGEDGKFGTSGTPSGYDNDWYKSNDGQLIPGSSGGEWSLDINKDGQFNPSGTNSHVVYYKLRAKHNDGTLGNWSETRKITIDKDTPVIRNVKIVQGSANERYESNMWIGNGNKFTAQLADGSGLKRVEISSQYLNGGFKYVKTTEAIAAGWTAMPSGWLTDFSENGESGYNLTLPIDNLQNIAAAAGGKFKIKIEIWENKTTAPLNTYSEYEFRFDTVAPSGSFGEYMLVNTANFGTDSINDGSIASAVTDYTADGGNINNLGMLIKNTPVKITSVSGSTVSFTPNIPEAGSCNYILYKKKTLIYNMGTSHWVIHGVANDDGSGIKEVRAKVKVGTASSAEAVISGTKISRQLGGQVSWSGSIDLHSLPDGVGTLHYQIIDASGNTYNVGDEYGGNASGPYNSITNPNPNRAISVTVKNKPIKVSKVTLKTKIGGFEKEFANSDTNGALTETTDRATAAKRDSTFDFVSSNFTFKDKDYSKIKVDFTGGEATVQYRLKKGDTVLQALTDLPVGGEINLENHLNTIGNSNGAVQELLLELWDAAKGLNQGATSAFAKITIKTLFEAIDKKPPVPAISPFYWSSEADNSLYQNSRKNGHIEIKEDLTGDFTASDGLMDKDDKVSGKISIRGTAHDDQVIKEILGHITSFTFVGITGAASGAETKLTEYDFSSKKFKDIGTVTNSYDPNDMSKPQRSDYADDEQYKAALDAFLKKRTDFFNANGWLFTITDSKFDVQTGHTVKWQLDWDSSKITDGVGTDKKITIKVKDQSTEPSHTVSAMRQVDVVPYITEVETAKRTNSGLSKNTIRASNGKYSVIKGSIADFIEVKGFNLQKGTETPVVKLVKADSIGTVTSNNSEGTAITPSSSSNTSFKISNDVNLSGYLEVFVDGVRAINNINANDKPYNKEEDAVLLKNKTLTDDCYLRLFDMKKTQISNGYYPEMIMDGNDPVFGLINPAGYQPSYGKTISFAWPLPALYQTQRIKFDSASGNIAMTGGIAQIEYIAGAINWDQFAMAKDTSNKYHYISVYNYNNAGMMYAYHSYAELEKSYMNKVGGWGAGSGYSGYNGKFAGEVGNNALVLDSLAYKTSSSILERYRYPKILAKGDSNTAAGASVYIAYYDAVNNDTTKQGIKFRSFKIGDNLTGGTRSMANTIKSNFDGYSVKIETSGNPSWRTWRGYFHPNDSNGRQEVGKGGSRFFDMGVTSDNHVVIVYFDEEEAKLKVKYSEIAIDGSNPTGTITWKDAAVTFPQYVGTYVSMDIDSNNGIHIAAFDSNDGDLKYFYLPSYNSSSLTSMTVDAAFSVGQWTQIKVRDGKPYIAYYSNTEAGQRSAIKLAVAEGTVTTTGNGGIGTVAAGVDEQGFVTGKWDCMTVPSVTPAQGGTPKFKKVNLGFDTSGRPVLGYLGENIEFGKWLDE